MKLQTLRQILFFGGAALTAAGGLSGLIALARVQRALRVIRAPLRTLREATPLQRAAFDLTVTGAERGPVIAPFSEKRCVWCRSYVRERQGRWRKLTNDRVAGEEFHATDANGNAVRVSAALAEVQIPFKVVNESTFGGDPPPVARWLKERGLAQGVIRYSFNEATLEPNDRILVIGQMTLTPGGEPQIRAQRTLDMIITRGTRTGLLRTWLALALGAVVLVAVGVVMLLAVSRVGNTDRAPARATTPAKPTATAAPTTRALPTSAPAKPPGKTPARPTRR